jgi:hypothetical protein
MCRSVCVSHHNRRDDTLLPFLQVMDMEFSSDGSRLTTAAGKHVSVFASDSLTVLSSRAMDSEIECASLCPTDASRVVVGGEDMWGHLLDVSDVPAALVFGFKWWWWWAHGLLADL